MPFPKITGLHAYFIFAIVILFTISLEHITTQGIFRASETRHINHPSTTIGIELGRSHYRIATFRDHVFEIVVDEQGRSKIPSCVKFSGFEGPLIGLEAEDQTYDDLTITIRELSALLGRESSDPELQVSIRDLPYAIVAKDNQVLKKVPADGVVAYLTAEAISSHQLKHVQNIAEVYLNQTVDAAVTSVPSHFNDTQTKAVGRAALSAELSAELLVSEARAAGNAYRTDSMITRRDKG